jgi:copper(I)-binding protein
MPTLVFAAALFSLSGSATPCPLVFVGAWIRLATPGAMLLAGFGVVRNGGDTAITVLAWQSPEFADVAMHETRIEDGIARMRPLAAVVVPAHGAVVFEPGAKHLMLMRPAAPVDATTRMTLRVETSCGTVVVDDVVVRDDADAR